MTGTLVMGTGRSGGAAIGGALHAAGWYMGDDLIEGDGYNERGYFESRAWWRLDRECAQVMRNDGLGYSYGAQYRALAERYIDRPLWAIKSPFLITTLPIVAGALGDDWRIVAVHRRYDHTATSMARHGRMPLEDGQAMALQFAAMLYETVADSNVPLYHVQYEALCADPAAIVPPLIDFCRGDVEVPQEAIDAAVRWIEPELNHG